MTFDSSPIGIIDIGSNSVRLVVYEAPFLGERPVFNEKVQCGLGEDIDRTGLLSPKAKARTLQTLGGFMALCGAMGIVRIVAVATAALRDASDGAAFALEIKENIGLEVNIISGEDEALYSGLGVLAAFPEAKGIGGDLGGGSLELVSMEGGAAIDKISMPIGVLRICGKDENSALDYLKRHIESIPDAFCGYEDFYSIGGTWRALSYAYIKEHRKKVVSAHGFKMNAKKLAKFAKDIAKEKPVDIMKTYHFEQRRAELLPAAALVMSHLLPRLDVETVIVSTSGLRDGLLRAYLEGAV